MAWKTILTDFSETENMIKIYDTSDNETYSKYRRLVAEIVDFGWEGPVDKTRIPHKYAEEITDAYSSNLQMIWINKNNNSLIIKANNNYYEYHLDEEEFDFFDIDYNSYDNDKGKECNIGYYVFQMMHNRIENEEIMDSFIATFPVMVDGNKTYFSSQVELDLSNVADDVAYDSVVEQLYVTEKYDTLKTTFKRIKILWKSSFKLKIQKTILGSEGTDPDSETSSNLYIKLKHKNSDGDDEFIEINKDYYKVISEDNENMVSTYQINLTDYYSGYNYDGYMYLEINNKALYSHGGTSAYLPYPCFFIEIW